MYCWLLLLLRLLLLRTLNLLVLVYCRQFYQLLYYLLFNFFYTIVYSLQMLTINVLTQIVVIMYNIYKILNCNILNLTCALLLNISQGTAKPSKLSHQVLFNTNSTKIQQDLIELSPIILQWKHLAEAIIVHFLGYSCIILLCGQYARSSNRQVTLLLLYIEWNWV